MPNRIIRESCRSSPTLAQLSAEAERLFWRLTTVADDHGRFEAEPMVVMADCFKAMLHRVKVTQVQAWLSELVTCGLVTAYVSGGKRFGEFTTWTKHQRVRAETSKYPPPSSADIGGQLLSDAPVVGSRSRESRVGGMESGKAIVVMSDDQFIESLRSNPAYRGIDLERELGRMDAWLSTPKAKGRKRTRQFIVNWLNRIDRQVGPESSGLMNPKNEAVARRFLERHQGES